MNKIALILVPFLVACATPTEREMNYWKARGTWVATQEGFNEFLKMDNAQVQGCWDQVPTPEVCDAMLGAAGRQVADGIVDEAELLFIELDGKVSNDTYAEEVMTGLGRASALGLRLMLIYTTAETKGVE
jgi:hypothetical protein